MERKAWVLILLLVMGFAAIQSYAQYTGFDVEQTKPPSLFPTIGRGDTAIIGELRETNRLLSEQNRLLSEQNRLLRANLNKR